MKRYTFFFTILSIILMIILTCATVSAEDVRVGKGLGDGSGVGYDARNSSIWTDLLSTKYILGGFIALLGLILLKNVKINQNTRTILMFFVFVLNAYAVSSENVMVRELRQADNSRSNICGS